MIALGELPFVADAFVAQAGEGDRQAVELFLASDMPVDTRNKDGVTLPPGQYQARLKVGDNTSTEPFNLLIDPRVAEDGVTVADLQEQFEHNMRVRQMVNDANQIAARVREFQTKVRAVSASGGPDEVNRVNAIASKLFTEPVRYGKPGLQAHITYLASMTANVDQKVGRDAIERYAVLRKELDAIRAELDRVLGPTPTTASGSR